MVAEPAATEPLSCLWKGRSIRHYSESGPRRRPRRIGCDGIPFVFSLGYGSARSRCRRRSLLGSGSPSLVLRACAARGSPRTVRRSSASSTRDAPARRCCLGGLERTKEAERSYLGELAWRSTSRRSRGARSTRPPRSGVDAALVTRRRDRPADDEGGRACRARRSGARSSSTGHGRAGRGARGLLRARFRRRRPKPTLRSGRLSLQLPIEARTHDRVAQRLLPRRAPSRSPTTTLRRDRAARRPGRACALERTALHRGARPRRPRPADAAPQPPLLPGAARARGCAGAPLPPPAVAARLRPRRLHRIDARIGRHGAETILVELARAAPAGRADPDIACRDRRGRVRGDPPRVRGRRRRAPRQAGRARRRRDVRPSRPALRCACRHGRLRPGARRSTSRTSSRAAPRMPSRRRERRRVPSLPRRSEGRTWFTRLTARTRSSAAYARRLSRRAELRPARALRRSRADRRRSRA